MDVIYSYDTYNQCIPEHQQHIQYHANRPYDVMPQQNVVNHDESGDLLLEAFFDQYDAQYPQSPEDHYNVLPTSGSEMMTEQYQVGNQPIDYEDKRSQQNPVPMVQQHYNAPSYDPQVMINQQAVPRIRYGKYPSHDAYPASPVSYRENSPSSDTGGYNAVSNYNHPTIKSQWMPGNNFSPSQEMSNVCNYPPIPSCGNESVKTIACDLSKKRLTKRTFTRGKLIRKSSYHCKRRTGGKGKPGSRSKILWKFLLKMLLSGEHDSQIMWLEKKKGTFKFINSSAVASLWGKHKNKPNMTYETLSRSIRFYYKSQILRKVPKQRLVYQFVNMEAVKAFIEEFCLKRI